ncbi:cadmium resistance transporter [Actinophytocola algeriensis]|uniref:Cadmium resistance protein CadD (Predicted permease) n=1 Tax=Actinophytocola algeriensis TaxID=1768010 RepID=A0A7W7Q922_9PSEU|nr:cadmium resistance transporter [Actinophytocola algeriensis]MBB4909083.1 cadmium resistance protein CadD (predicted permease) [Actinophytocola algeriensis]MBE1474529.1 cadmium resistance protein CadD (predicted permease) [Actinophytocola algeriensis]
MHWGFVGQAVGMFAVTNVDDLVLLALFFARGVALRVVVGQYLGFGVLLAVSVVGALGASLLPESLLPWLGLVPLLLGLRAAWQVWRARRDGDEPDPVPGPSVLAVATVTIANGGDNIGVYVPVFAVAGTAGLVAYVVVFLVLVGVWCAVGRFLATRPVVARTLARRGHVVLPVVLVAVGLLILFGVW